ncbi:hypothetical protein NQ317_015902 [Molorchus minor]|uniref:FAD-binding FR-type domain-containing protein n=1 Tax=Molorchus minor TaxID=1323400 RepID=A0ABQ9JE52_9CUCU|nr:hypothetical protein NQ317_015902 [Molorchus minor]
MSHLGKVDKKCPAGSSQWTQDLGTEKRAILPEAGRLATLRGLTKEESPSKLQFFIPGKTQKTWGHYQFYVTIIDRGAQEYCPGDLLVLRPRNLPWQVEEFKQVLLSNEVNIPLTLSLKFTQNDPQSTCSRSLRAHTFQILAQITRVSELEREKMYRSLLPPKVQNDLYSYTNRPRRSFMRFSSRYPRIFLRDILFEILLPIKPREFSIASSFKLHNDEIHILLAVVKYKTNLVKERFGLCSNFLADLQKETRLLHG